MAVPWTQRVTRRYERRPVCAPIPRHALGHARAMRPPSFDEEYMTEWSEFVLDHGLPEFPATLQPGQSVPVARWAGPRFGAVLHVQWSWTNEHENDVLVSEVQVFDRVL